ncbi:MAG: ParB/RepB/Spo0J family partition protein [Prevotellaceae bacterium]|jgi:ParB family chromosome partitioning protein|nr:ParB/RepB/Spo0J family partition protein [Prevotellaceae bacterium]
MAKHTGLGKGLGALIDTGDVQTGGSSSINEVYLTQISANPNQPRTHFDEETLDELAASIRELGVISPITLRKNADGTYLIIAGERRFRAAKMAGLDTIPAYVKTAADEQVVEMALIENIQREDLNAIEIALSFNRLIEEYQLTQERLSERVGKKRATIANYLRLLRLPAEIQMGIKNKKIEMGHARALLSLDSPAQQLKLYEETVQNAYSVRKVEELVKQLVENEKSASEDKNAKEENPIENLNVFTDIKSQLSRVFGTGVKFICNAKGKGKIEIPFANDNEMARIMELLDKLPQT